MKNSTITITDEARRQAGRLSEDLLPITEADMQLFKNWILDQCREVCPEKMDLLELPGAMIDFVPRHYKPLGLRVIVYRSNGINVWVGAISEEMGIA